ncbi:hypothetical protein BC831DRAFT_457890, partial [Entophlyctis helioformis]
MDQTGEFASVLFCALPFCVPCRDKSATHAPRSVGISTETGAGQHRRGKPHASPTSRWGGVVSLDKRGCAMGQAVMAMSECSAARVLPPTPFASRHTQCDSWQGGCACLLCLPPGCSTIAPPASGDTSCGCPPLSAWTCSLLIGGGADFGTLA